MAASTMKQNQDQAIVRGILESVSDQKIILRIPGTSYELHLVPAVPAAQIAVQPGKRIKGTIHAKALRMYTASGGGRFIEPIAGEPRIVAGQVLAIEPGNRRALVDVSVPMWMTLLPDEPDDKFSVGDLVNCYVESGARFTPA